MLGVTAGTAALFLGGLSRPLGGAVGGIHVLGRHRPGAVLGVVVAVAVSQGAAAAAPAGVPAVAAAALGLAAGGLATAAVPPLPARAP